MGITMKHNSKEKKITRSISPLVCIFLGVIPFRLNNSAYDVLITSFTFSVGGASCPASEGLDCRY